MNCDHEELTVFDDGFTEIDKRDDGVPEAVIVRARCDECNRIVPIEYSLTRVDGRYQA